MLISELLSVVTIVVFFTSPSLTMGLLNVFSFVNEVNRSPSLPLWLPNSNFN